MGIQTGLYTAGAALLCGSLGGIIVDGDRTDWPGGSVVLVDAENDAPRDGADFLEVRATNDAYNLYLLVEFAEPVDLRLADLQLLIDSDNDPDTALFLPDPGMDILWDFDRNRGTNLLASRSDIGRGNVIQRIAPDGPATLHEIAVSLEALPAVAAGEPVHLVLSEANSGDRIPDNGNRLAYTANGPLGSQPLPIDWRRDGRSLRIVSWNVLRDAPFENNGIDPLRRVLFALQPDIFLFQEIYDTDTGTVLQLFRETLQLRPGSEWQAARQYDCITISRFPITGAWGVDGNIVSRHATAEALGSDLLIANAHLPCCQNENGRIEEAGNILDVLERQLAGPAGVPQAVLVGGDLNSGGLAPELVMLANGPRRLEMPGLRHLYSVDQYSWGSLGSSFGSSRLDFLLFEPGRLLREKAFILDTDLVPPDGLAAMGLEPDDTFLSDHLPIVLDVRNARLPDILQAGPMAPDGSTTSAWWGPVNGLDYPDLVDTAAFGPVHLRSTAEGLWFKPANSSGSWMWTGPAYWPWTYMPQP